MRIRTSVIAAIAFTFIASAGGCLDRQLGTVGGVADTLEPPADAAGDGSGAEVTNEVVEPGDVQAPDAPSCILVEHIAKVGATEFGAHGGAQTFLPPFVDGAKVYGHLTGTEFSNAPNDTEIIGVSAGEGETEQLTANDGNDVIVDARDGVLLVERVSETGARQLLRIEGGAETVLEAEITSGTGYAPWVEQYAGVGRRRTWGARSVWRIDGQLRLYEGGSVKSVPTAAQWVGSPDGHGDSFVFAAQDTGAMGTKVLLYRGGELVSVVDDGLANRFPVLGAERVFWNAEGAILSKRLDALDKAPEVLAEGPCGVPSADGDWAVFACTSDATLFSGAGPFWTEATELYAFDGTQVRQIPTSGQSVQSPTVYGGRVAWAEYDDSSAGGEIPQGQVWVATMLGDGTWLKTAIAPIGSGCYWCQVPAAPVQVRLSKGAAAWNFPLADAVQSETGIGHASIQDVHACP